MRESLQDFIGAAKTAGASDDFLATLLVRRGWPAEEVYSALGDYWASRTGIPIPVRAGSAESSRDAFLYLLSFSTLATWATALGSLLFEFVDHWIPNALATASGRPPRASITWQLASIAVAFPIYLLVMRTIVRETLADTERLKSGVRRWLTWLALLIAAGLIIGDLISFLNEFLVGDVTSVFILKSVIVFCVAGAIFGYYLGSLRWDGTGDLAREKVRNVVFGGATAITVAAAFAVGLSIAGTPSEQRRIEADNKRVADLAQIARAIRVWHSQSAEPLPASIDDPVLARIAGPVLADPETGKPYQYRPLPDGRYQLCAVFDESSEPGSPQFGPFWRHPSGLTCFTLQPETGAPGS